MMNSNLEQIQERQRVRARIVSLATVVCLTAAMFTVTAFAANTETAQGFQQITSAGKTILKGIWDMLQAITAPLALVGILYFVGRIIGKYAGSYLGCLFASKSKKVRNNLGLARTTSSRFCLLLASSSLLRCSLRPLPARLAILLTTPRTKSLVDSSGC